jgi:hypothetical protein
MQEVTTKVEWNIIIEHFPSSAILSSLVFYLQSCSTFSLFYNIQILTTRLSCDNINLQKILRNTMYSDESFFVQIASRRRWLESPGKSLYRPFLPLVFSTFGLFYAWSFLPLVVFYFWSCSTFSLSTFGHSTFCHFLPAVILRSVILRSVCSKNSNMNFIQFRTLYNLYLVPCTL